jgi:hypothetical protein
MSPASPAYGRSWLLSALLAAPLLVLAATAPDVRPIVDDLCYEARMEPEGVLGTWTFHLQQWSGTWLQHLLSLLVAAPGGWWAYAAQSLALLLGLSWMCLALVRPRVPGGVAAAALPTLGLTVCCLAALRGSLVGPAYPGLAGAFAWPAAGLLHLLPVLLWLPLTVRWWSRADRTPPLGGIVALAVVLTGTGIQEAAAAALVWAALALRARWRGVTWSSAPAARWLLGAGTLSVGLVAVYLSPGSRNRSAALALEPSSAALNGSPLVDLPLYAAFYTGGIFTSPGVWAAAALGIALAARGLDRPGRGDAVLAGAVPGLVLAQAAAAVFAYPAFWHLQPVQVAAAVAAYALGRRIGAARRTAAPSWTVPAAALLAVAVALPPVLVTRNAVGARAEAFEAARAATAAAPAGAPAVPPAYALGRRDGAVLPDAGAGAAGYGRCWADAQGRPGVREVAEPSGPRGILPTLPLPVLGQ